MGITSSSLTGFENSITFLPSMGSTPRKCLLQLQIPKRSLRITYCTTYETPCLKCIDGVIAALCRLWETVWIPKDRRSVKRILKNCLVCQKYNAKPARQHNDQLLEDRVIACPPFITMGTDFTEAIHVKSYTGVFQRVYNVLFACAVTRAVHLETTQRPFEVHVKYLEASNK
ncbi:integrase catalytic domain-containing protein [Nephila pilipes]|uniref:Integrase catalytic domain-containing protein n=1 Tax=Nephila pilipes TaxID=299642 RepID=A0A8X6MKP9_NEPPI|nr:integrase catalytic domain-containing protein [Nephila pilipes]